jgi:hypothetical protein
MKFHHHGMEIELSDSWWVEAQMEGFVPIARAYNTDASSLRGRVAREISIQDVAPLVERRKIGIFRENEEACARDRVVQILRGFRQGDLIPPVEIANCDEPYKYKLVHGAHRFYCSLAVGFTHVPTVEGFDWEDQ